MLRVERMIRCSLELHRRLRLLDDFMVDYLLAFLYLRNNITQGGKTTPTPKITRRSALEGQGPSEDVVTDIATSF